LWLAVDRQVQPPEILADDAEDEELHARQQEHGGHDRTPARRRVVVHRLDEDQNRGDGAEDADAMPVSVLRRSGITEKLTNILSHSRISRRSV